MCGKFFYICSLIYNVSFSFNNFSFRGPEFEMNDPVTVSEGFERGPGNDQGLTGELSEVRQERGGKNNGDGIQTGSDKK